MYQHSVIRVVLSAVALILLGGCSESLLPSIGNPNQQALLPNVTASCSEANPATDCTSSFDENEAQIFLLEKSNNTQSIYSSCAAVKASLEAQTFSLTPAAVGRSDLDCDDDGMNTSCSLNRRVVWEDANGSTIFQAVQAQYILLSVFKNEDDSDDVTNPIPGDYIQCSELTLNENTIENDVELDAATDTLDINWPFGAIPNVTFSCSEASNSDCTIMQNNADIRYTFFSNTSCVNLQNQIENALITDDKVIDSESTASCFDAATDSCSSSAPLSWSSYGLTATSSTILNGDYAVLTHLGDISGFPINGDVMACKEVSTDGNMSAINLQSADLLNINWPSLAVIEQVDMSCSSNGSANCSVASIDSNDSTIAYIKDASCAQIIVSIEQGDQGELAFHAVSEVQVSCMSTNPNTCLSSANVWESGIEGGSDSLTEIPQGNYGVISFVDQLGEGDPSPGDVLHCREVVLGASSIGNIVLNDSNIIEPDYPIILTPALTASCDNSSGGTADCVASLDGQSADYFLFQDIDCATLLTGSGPSFAIAAGTTASCVAGSPETCTQNVASNQWQDDDNNSVTFVEKGSYALTGYINADGMNNEPEAGDPIWCKDVVLSSSTTSLSLGNADLEDL